ncbi:hypothetical protein [Rhizobium johnstonii]
MTWFSDMIRDRDERHAILKERQSIEIAEEHFRKVTEGLKPRDDAYQTHLADLFFERDLAFAEISEIETKRARRQADRWRVPLPTRPFKDDEQTEFWEWHAPHHRYYISDKGHSQLRREIYQEWEMWWKPWLSWVAVAISLLSLAISFLK